jgi:DNA polymerase elongation subunit (family B)
METIEDESQKSVLNGLQLAYKVVANSVYGQCGSSTSPIRKLEVAACTTAAGRQRIRDAKMIVETEFGGEVIYGDTDSIFIKFDLRNADGGKPQGIDLITKAIALGQNVEETIKIDNDNNIKKTEESLQEEVSLMDMMMLAQAEAAKSLKQKKVEENNSKGLFGSKGFKKGFLSNNNNDSNTSINNYKDVIDVNIKKDNKNNSKTSSTVIEEVKKAVSEEQEKQRKEEEEKFPLLKNLSKNGKYILIL